MSTPRRFRPPADEAPTADSRTSRLLPRAAFASAAACFAWAAAATWYIASRDELAQRFFAHQAELRYAYEDRIGELQRRLEREVTHGLVERTGFTKRADLLASRQAELETRLSWLRATVDRSGSARPPAAAERPMPPPRPGSMAVAPPGLDEKPTPLGEGLGLRLGSGADVSGEPVPTLGDRLSAVEGRLDLASGTEVRLLDLIRRDVAARTGQVRTALEATGLKADRLGVAAAGIGGPLVDLSAGDESTPFATLATEIEARSAELLRLRAAARTLPLARPVAGDADQTSSFGYRVDPFTRGLAMHTGMDLKAETGTPVRAAGAGRVTDAEISGGYGLMVEIDHGGGITTRYGHLSAVTVLPGDRVEAGSLIGRAGSTGRSTGPHLHYETRIGGEPVNPSRFLEAGRLFAAAESMP